MTRTFAIGIFLAAVVALGGCASFFGPTPEEQQQAIILEERAEQERSDIVSIKDMLRQLEETLALNLTEQEQEQIAALREELESKYDEKVAAIDGLEERVATLLNPDTTLQEGVGTGIQAVGGFLPPPLNLIAAAVGSAIIGGAAEGERRRRRHNRQTENIVVAINEGRNGDGTIDWGKVGKFQEIMGVRKQVRRITDDIARREREARDVISGPGSHA